MFSAPELLVHSPSLPVGGGHDKQAEMWHLGTATRFLLGIYKLESNWSTLPVPLSHRVQHRAKTPLDSFSTPWPTRPSSGVERRAPPPDSCQPQRQSTRFRDETESPVNNEYLKTSSSQLQRADTTSTATWISFALGQE